MAETSIKDVVKEKYGEVARRAATEKTSCCAPTCCGGERDPITSDLYSLSETAGLPAAAVSASLGCGNPTALAKQTRSAPPWPLPAPFAAPATATWTSTRPAA